MLAQKWNGQDEELSKILFALSESLSSPQTIELRKCSLRCMKVASLAHLTLSRQLCDYKMSRKGE